MPDQPPPAPGERPRRLASIGHAGLTSPPDPRPASAPAYEVLIDASRLAADRAWYIGLHRYAERWRQAHDAWYEHDADADAAKDARLFGAYVRAKKDLNAYLLGMPVERDPLPGARIAAACALVDDGETSAAGDAAGEPAGPIVHGRGPWDPDESYHRCASPRCGGEYDLEAGVCHAAITDDSYDSYDSYAAEQPGERDA